MALEYPAVRPERAISELGEDWRGKRLAWVTADGDLVIGEYVTGDPDLKYQSILVPAAEIPALLALLEKAR